MSSTQPILLRLIAIEWFKTVRRSVFWGICIIYAAMLCISIGAQQYMHAHRPKVEAFMIGKDWPQALMLGDKLGGVLIMVSIALLVASESTWRTQRQNVIDGLSRGQYFTGKLIIALLHAVIILGITLVFTPILARFGGPEGWTAPLLPHLSLLLMLGLLLALAGVAATAFMMGMFGASSGAALAGSFLFLIAGQLIAQLLWIQKGVYAQIARRLPTVVWGNLTSWNLYQPGGLDRMRQASEQTGMLISPVSMRESALLTVAYIILFIAVTWFSFRKRDL